LTCSLHASDQFAHTRIRYIPTSIPSPNINIILLLRPDLDAAAHALNRRLAVPLLARVKDDGDAARVILDLQPSVIGSSDDLAAVDVGV
jgi:hypothetical protein